MTPAIEMVRAGKANPPSQGGENEGRAMAILEVAVGHESPLQQRGKMRGGRPFLSPPCEQEGQGGVRLYVLSRGCNPGENRPNRRCGAPRAVRDGGSAIASAP